MKPDTTLKPHPEGHTHAVFCQDCLDEALALARREETDRIMDIATRYLQPVPFMKFCDEVLDGEKLDTKGD